LESYNFKAFSIFLAFTLGLLPFLPLALALSNSPLGSDHINIFGQYPFDLPDEILSGKLCPFCSIATDTRIPTIPHQ